MKKGITKIATGALAMVFACSLASCNGGGSGNTDYGYMTIDINPSVEFIIEDGVVVDVAADNTDGEVLIADEVLEGKTVKEATEKVVDLAEQLGYLTETNKRVKITVVADDADVESQIEADATEGATEGSEIAEINHEPRSKDKRKEKSLNNDKLKAEKIRLIEELMEYDETLTYEAAAGMSIKDLVEALKEYRKEFEGIDGEELKEHFKQVKDQMKTQLQEQLSNLLGEEYGDLYTAYQALATAYETLEDKAENVSISDEDVQSILSLLGLTADDLSLISDGEGAVTVDTVDEYMDKYYEDIENDEAAAEDVEDQIDDILETYDDMEDTYLLTQEDYDALVAVWGDNQPALPAYEELTLSAVEEFVEDVEDSLEDMAESIKAELSIVHKQMMESIEQAFDEIAKSAHEQMQGVINQYKDSYRNPKADRAPRAPAQPEAPAEA